MYINYSLPDRHILTRNMSKCERSFTWTSRRMQVTCWQSWEHIHLMWTYFKFCHGTSKLYNLLKDVIVCRFTGRGIWASTNCPTCGTLSSLLSSSTSLVQSLVFLHVRLLWFSHVPNEWLKNPHVAVGHY